MQQIFVHLLEGSTQILNLYDRAGPEIEAFLTMGLGDTTLDYLRVVANNTVHPDIDVDDYCPPPPTTAVAKSYRLRIS